MKVYKLAASTDALAKEKWLARNTSVAGTYGSEQLGFQTMEDASGNLCCGTDEDFISQMPFVDEIKACSKIEFISKQINLPR